MNKPPFTSLLGDKASPRFTPTHRHKKTGGEYMLTGAGIVQTATPLKDLDVVMIYEAPDGRLYVRGRSEFYDGRFESLKELKP